MFDVSDTPYDNFMGRYSRSLAPQLADLTKNYFTPGGAYYDRAANFKANAPGTVAEYSNMGIVLAVVYAWTG